MSNVAKIAILGAIAAVPLLIKGADSLITAMARNADNGVRVVDRSATKLGKQTDSLAKTIPELSDIYKLKEPLLREITISEKVVSECMRSGWRIAIRDELMALESADSNLKYFEGKALEKAKSIFSKDILNFGPIKMNARLLDQDLVLQMDTPCGSDRLISKLNEGNGMTFELVNLSQSEKNAQLNELLQGKWKFFYELEDDGTYAVITGTTRVTGRKEKYRIQMGLKQANTDSFTWAFDISGSGDFYATNSGLYSKNNHISFDKIYDPQGSFTDDIRSSFIEEAKIAYMEDIIFLTNDILQYKDEDGLILTLVRP